MQALCDIVKGHWENLSLEQQVKHLHFIFDFLFLV